MCRSRNHAVANPRSYYCTLPRMLAKPLTRIALQWRTPQISRFHHLQSPRKCAENLRIMHQAHWHPPRLYLRTSNKIYQSCCLSTAVAYGLMPSPNFTRTPTRPTCLSMYLTTCPCSQIYAPLTTLCQTTPKGQFCMWRCWRMKTVIEQTRQTWRRERRQGDVSVLNPCRLCLFPGRSTPQYWWLRQAVLTV